MGFYVFPLMPNTKAPAIENFTERSTRDPEKIRAMWVDPVMGIEQPYNVGIAMRGEFMAIDVDNKEDRRGSESILELELEGKFLPPTYTQTTPSGGVHYVYRLPPGVVVRNSSSKLRRGVDVRGMGGLLVGSGSCIEGKKYGDDERGCVLAPAWPLDFLRRVPEVRGTSGLVGDHDPKLAERRAASLAATAPGSSQGNRDSRAYSLACEMSNLGCNELTAYELLDELWAPRCDPPFSSDELMTPVGNAFRYCRDKGAINAPESEFDVVEEEPPPVPLEVQFFNKEHAFVMCGSVHQILHETEDAFGVSTIELMKEQSFHAKYAARNYFNKKGEMKFHSRDWMRSPHRKSYAGFCFSPGKAPAPGYYNLFRGFTVKPLEGSPSADAQRSLDRILQHLRDNIAGGEESHAQWILGFFAHMVQRPWEKPIVSLVLRGPKGVGKNALVDAFGNLVGGNHFVTCWSRHQVLGNFNSQLERCLLLNLNEAFWSGDKSIEGTLKGLITESTMRIERKGVDAYETRNYMRIVIMGNEDWLIPATSDERRYAVFDVGEAKQQDWNFFEPIKQISLEGQQLIMRYLMEFDLSTVNLYQAPQTRALTDQKLQNAGTLDKWWFESLYQGRLYGLGVGEKWPELVSKEDLRDAYQAYHAQQTRFPPLNPVQFGMAVKRVCPGLTGTLHQARGVRYHAYQVPALAEARAQFAAYIKGVIEWPQE
jgi:hypothetical protein